MPGKARLHGGEKRVGVEAAGTLSEAACRLAERPYRAIYLAGVRNQRRTGLGRSSGVFIFPARMMSPLALRRNCCEACSPHWTRLGACPLADDLVGRAQPP